MSPNKMLPSSQICAVLAVLALLFSGVHHLSAWTHGSGPTSAGLPLIVPGTLVPTAQTPLMPSASTWGPSCGGSGNSTQDAAWGTGCTVATGFCIAPTGGTPSEPCQPPQMLFPTGGTGNGTTATINYTSYAHYAYTPSTPLIVTGATQANWNSETIGITSFATGGSSPNFTVTLGCLTTCVNLVAGQTIYVGQATGTSAGNDMPGTGWTTGNPNGAWTVQMSGAGSVTFSTGTTQVTGTLGGLIVGGPTAGLNNLLYNGTIIRPWNITASSCTGAACSVSFTNPNACSSSCVSSTTQIAAGQNDDVILDWHFGEDIPNSVQNTDVQECVLAKHISPIQYVAISVDGGAWTTITTPVVDPWGSGKSGLSPTAVKVYCAHFTPDPTKDGLHEIRAVGCATSGICGHLSDPIAVDCTNASTFCKANNHGIQSFKLVGITKSSDAQFQNYDWRLFSSVTSFTSRTAASSGTSAATFTLGYTQPLNLSPLVAGTPVYVSGVTTTSCTGTATGAVATGAALNFTYTSTGVGAPCNFPVNSEVSIAGVAAATTATITSGTYTSGTGVISLTFSSAPFGTSPATGAGTSAYFNQYNLTLTGTGSIASLNGTHILQSSSAGGTVLNFLDSTGLTLTIGGGTVGGNGLTWNSQANTGTVVSSSNGSSTISVPSISTGVWASGGTITGNWNGVCVAQSGTGSGTLTCPQPFNTETTATGGTITTTGNLYCTVGGNGDWPSPYDPAQDMPSRSQQLPDSLQFISYSGSNCTGAQQGTGCAIVNCGLLPSQTETLWITRKDAGLDERNTISPDVMVLTVNGSAFIYTNAGGHMMGQNSYVDSWQSSTGGSTCVGSPTPVQTYGTTLPSFASGGAATKCNDLRHATSALLPVGSGQVQTVTGTGSGCTTFTRAGNTFYNGEPVIVNGRDITAAGTDGNGNVTPAFSIWSLYWAVGVSGTSFGLATTPNGACIEELNTNLIGGAGAGTAGLATVTADLGTSSLLLMCNTGAGCSSTNPETFVNMATVPGLTGNDYYAKSAYLNIAADVADGATHATVSIINGGNIWFTSAISQGGHLRLGVDSNQKVLTLTEASGITVGPTPPKTTVTSGGAVGTTETLNFAALSGVAWQAATGTGNLGQGIVVSGMTPSTGNCGTTAAPCHITSANATSITFTNPGAATATYTGFGTILPASIVLEFAPGTLAYDASTNTHGDCAGSNNTAINTGPALACWTAYNIPSVYVNGTNGTAFPLYGLSSQLTTTLLDSSNCLPIQSGQSVGASTITSILTYLPAGASGSTNDIIELTNSSVASIGIVAANQCTGAFNFANWGFGFGQNSTAFMSAAWADSADLIGPSWYAPTGTTTNYMSANSTGAVYATNVETYNSKSSLDGFSYVWGSTAKYTFGTCINTDIVVVSSSCITGAFAVPYNDPVTGQFLGGSNVSNAVGGAYWLPVLGSTTSATGPGGSAVLCSGAPCVNSTTRTITVAQGTLPTTIQPGFHVTAECNMSFPLTASSFGAVSDVVVTAYDNVANPSTVTFAAGSYTQCLTSQNLYIIVDNETHIDQMFWSFNTSPAPIIGGFDWLHVSDVIYENMNSTGSSRTEGWVMGGGGLYTNMDMDDSTDYVWNVNVSGATANFKSIDMGAGGGYYNILFRNSNIYGALSWLADAASINNNDIYYYGDNAGTWLNFPVASQFSSLDTAFGSASRNTNNPPANAPTANGSSQNVSVWPTLTTAVDGAGNPTGGGTPWSGSLRQCPWAGAGSGGCLTGDTGNGSM